MQIDLENASREEIKAAYLALRKESTCTIEKLSKSEERVSFLELQVAWFKRQIFGQRSEKQIPQDPKQGTLFDVPEAPPSGSTTIKSYERTHRKNPSDTSEEDSIRFDDTVPIDEETVYPDEIKGLSEDQYEVIGEKVTTRLMQTPHQYRVKRTIRKTIKLKETKTLHTAPAPAAIIERSFADVSFLTGMIVDKFQFHLPLYRQHQRLKNSGVHVSRPHLTKLTHRTLELLEPVYYAILSDITTSDVVSMDETPVKAGRKEKGKMRTAYFWPVHAANQVAFVYSSTRAHHTVSEILGNGCKKLLSDGYSAYERYAEERKDLVHAECWAHARRKFFEAKEYASGECEKMLSWIARLFEIEKSLIDKPPDEVLSGRREYSTVIVDTIFTYLDSIWFDEMVDRGSPLGKAVFYARERKRELSQFLEHGDIPLSNNHVERAVRPVAVGRKNWMFCWSELGAKYAAIAFTLIESCKMNGVNPWDYIQDVLQRLDTHPARDVHLLTPKYWGKKKE
jgi:transposase